MILTIKYIRHDGKITIWQILQIIILLGKNYQMLKLMTKNMIKKRVFM